MRKLLRVLGFYYLGKRAQDTGPTADVARAVIAEKLSRKDK